MLKGVISRTSVLDAIAEFNTLGQDAFLTTYGYGVAREYLLVHEGREYDSKAIAGVAHKYEYGTALGSHDFSGGRSGAVTWLESAGFRVTSLRNPDWAQDELILACAITADNGWKAMRPNDPRVADLSAVLQLLPLHDQASRSSSFRNANSVARKTADLATHHPHYEGKPTKGGAADLAVLKAFLDSPVEMAAAAHLIRHGIKSGELLEAPPANAPDSDEEIDAPEGRLLLRKHLARERDRGLRKQKIESVLREGGRLTCEVCTFDFQWAYGDRGAGYIECHHIVPLHVTGESRTKLSDLALICANCHRMIHRRAPWPTPDELRALMPTQPS
ncbi:HNH endonuclease [Kitasatospora paranensis]|uniref:HNH endonuclease n=1 Tax=Kitasatospora paranensis TaxID=258053 RepID=A0ABW2FUR6_9ACTN